MASIITLIFILFCLTSTSYAKAISKYDLVRELRRHGFPEHQMQDLVRLVESESTFRIAVKGGPNVDGSFDWGLFQINDRYWCNASGSPGRGCNVRCNDLLSDDISASASCFKTILELQGIDAWIGWVEQCKGRPLPELEC